MKITYGINFYREFITSAEVNGKIVRIPFLGGRTIMGGTSPATYTTSDEDVQKAIEDMNYFKKGYITIINRSEDVSEAIGEPAEDDLVKEEESTAEEEKASENAFEDVKNSQKAKKVLMNSFGVPLSELGSKADILAKAGELGVSFPNWK